jgi:hypothetical protein
MRVVVDRGDGGRMGAASDTTTTTTIPAGYRVANMTASSTGGLQVVLAQIPVLPPPPLPILEEVSGFVQWGESPLVGRLCRAQLRLPVARETRAWSGGLRFNSFPLRSLVLPCASPWAHSRGSIG